MHFHNEQLAKLNKILDDIERNPTVIDDDTFETQLKEIQDQINDLYEFAKGVTNSDDKSLVQKLDEIQQRQKEIERTLSDIDESIFSATDKGTLAQESVDSAQDTLKAAGEELNEAIRTLQVDGKAALEKAKQTAKEFGQQSDKMTNIAQEARHRAEALDAQAEDIAKVAQEAKNKSTQAYDLAKNTIARQINATQQIKDLKYEVAKMENRLNETKEWTESVYKKAKDAKDNALNLLKEVNNIIIPDVDIPKLKEKSDRIKQEALKLINDTDDLISQHEDLLNEVYDQLSTGEELLRVAMIQQDDANDLLGDIDLAGAQARHAVELGDKTLKEAQATLETLSRK